MAARIPEMSKFFIFDISRGQIEGHERDKIIYHWTKGAPNCRADLKAQIQDVCLCDASINFCKKFDCLGSQQMMLFENSKLVTIEVERDLWFAASVSRLPARESSTTSSNLQSPSTSTIMTSSARLQPPQQQLITQSAESKRLKDNQPNSSEIPRSASANSLCNYQNGDNLSGNFATSDCASTKKKFDPDQLLSDQQTIPPDDTVVPNGVIELLLTNLYKRFCLFNGTFHMLNQSVNYNSPEDSSQLGNNNDQSLEKLRSICSEYFDQIVPSMKLYSIMTNINLIYSHIQYLNLDCISLMKVNSFVNQIMCLNSSVLTHSLVIFNNQLIWSSLNLHDTRILYRYLISTVIREALDEELSGKINKVRRIKNEQKIYLSKMKIFHNKNSWPKKTLPTALEPIMLTVHYMTIFRSSNDMTLCLIHRTPNVTLMDKCEKLLSGDPRIGLIPLASLAQMVGQTFVKMNSRFGQRGLNNFPVGSGSINTPLGGRGVDASVANDTKYVFFDHSNASYKSPIGLDIRKAIDGDSLLDNLKFSKYVLDFEMDAKILQTSCDIFMQELLGRTISDSWLTSSRTESRKLYSIHHNRNASLVEAHQSAISMKKQFKDILF